MNDEHQKAACAAAAKRLLEIADRCKKISGNPNASDDDRLNALELEGDLVMQALHVEVAHKDEPDEVDGKESWR